MGQPMRSSPEIQDRLGITKRNPRRGANKRIKDPKRTIRWGRVFFLSFLPALAVLTSMLFFRYGENIEAKEELTDPLKVTYPDYFESKQEWFLNHEKARRYLEKGKTFYDILTEYGASPSSIMRIEEKIREYFDPSRARVGQPIDLWMNKHSKEIRKISIILPNEKTLNVFRDGRDFVPSLVSHPRITSRNAVQGEVSGSFYKSAVEKGLPSDIIMEIADTFAWDIDFLVDIRPGDTFDVIFDEYYREGESIGHGRVLAVRFMNQGKPFEAFYFTDSRGRSAYFQRDGKSLRKAFLKSPLSYRRISSYFSLKRFHPILKVYRPHYGVDYAAPTGTPVESVANGRITFLGWKGGYGRYIKIRHNNVYQTGYGHLSRFARGLKKGSRVKQGQVIGYVGSSGLSTGPHLDFSVKKRGHFVDPLKIKSPPAFSLSKKDKNTFDKLINRMEQAWRGDKVS